MHSPWSRRRVITGRSWSLIPSNNGSFIQTIKLHYERRMKKIENEFSFSTEPTLGEWNVNPSSQIQMLWWSGYLYNYSYNPSSSCGDKNKSKPMCIVGRVSQPAHLFLPLIFFTSPNNFLCSWIRSFPCVTRFRDSSSHFLFCILWIHFLLEEEYLVCKGTVEIYCERQSILNTWSLTLSPL